MYKSHRILRFFFCFIPFKSSNIRISYIILPILFFCISTRNSFDVYTFSGYIVQYYHILQQYLLKRFFPKEKIILIKTYCSCIVSALYVVRLYNISLDNRAGHTCISTGFKRVRCSQNKTRPLYFIALIISSQNFKIDFYIFENVFSV